uniref:5-formyltetrahydrofolate cyclo-ligase n=1 Tax=uncultured Altererythrobacter sp. TaxID=500840 RepID=UPI003430DEAC
MAITKSDLRKKLRAKRHEHVEQLPESMRGLVFRHPPAPLLEKISPNASIGLYHAGPHEAPTASYIGYFYEKGHTIALPRFASGDAEMEFAEHTDPFEADDLEPGAYEMMQPNSDAALLVPDVLIIPLVGFTAMGHRLGQGGGHYDRYLAEHPERIAIGLAWDVQICDALPTEPHDQRLDAVITPTRMYGPF